MPRTSLWPKSRISLRDFHERAWTFGGLIAPFSARRSAPAVYTLLRSSSPNASNDDGCIGHPSCINNLKPQRAGFRCSCTKLRLRIHCDGCKPEPAGCARTTWLRPKALSGCDHHPRLLLYTECLAFTLFSLLDKFGKR